MNQVSYETGKAIVRNLKDLIDKTPIVPKPDFRQEYAANSIEENWYINDELVVKLRPLGGQSEYVPEAVTFLLIRYVESLRLEVRTLQKLVLEDEGS